MLSCNIGNSVGIWDESLGGCEGKGNGGEGDEKGDDDDDDDDGDDNDKYH